MIPYEKISRSALRTSNWLHANRHTCEAAHNGTLPTAPFDIGLSGEIFELEEIVDIICGFHRTLCQIGLQCLSEQRDLATNEAGALHIADCFVGYVGESLGGEAWPYAPLDLTDRLEFFNLLTR